MAQQIGMPACLILLVITYSVENGASNRSTGEFNIDNLLKLALVFLFQLKMARPIEFKSYLASNNL